MAFKAGSFHFIVMTVLALMVLALTGLVWAALAGAGLPAAAQERPIRLVGFGDSLMAGYELAPAESFPAQLQAALRARGHDVTIENAGVSGDTTSGGLARIDWSVPDGTDGVLLELGANDALRGIAPEETERNLDAMLARLAARDIPVLLIGMIAPPNMGEDYAAGFNPVYRRLAERHQIPLYPFFLDGVATVEGMQLADAMHPNARGVAVMVEKTLPAVKAFLEAIKIKAKAN